MRLPLLSSVTLLGALFFGAGLPVAADAPVSATQAKEAWSRDFHESIPPIFPGEKALFVCDGDQLSSLDLATGVKLWEVPSPVGKAWPSNVLDGSLILISESFEVASVEATTGKLRWKMKLDDLAKGGVGFGKVYMVNSPITKPVLADGKILMGTSGMKFFKGRTGKCYALDAATGKLTWVFELEDGMEHPPVIDGDRVFVGGVAASYALDLKKGEQLWKASTRSDNQFTFSLQNGQVLLSSGHYGSQGSSFSGTAYGLDAKSGQVRWKFDIGGPSVMSIGEGKAVGIEWGMMGGTRLSCIDLATGAKVWELKEKSSASPLVRNGKVVYQTRDNKVLVIDLQTGKPAGSFNAAGDFEMGWTSPWSRFLDPFLLGEKATVASWDKGKKQTILQSVDLEKGAVAEEVRVDGRLLRRPLLAGGHMVCAVENRDHKVTLRVF